MAQCYIVMMQDMFHSMKQEQLDSLTLIVNSYLSGLLIQNV